MSVENKIIDKNYGSIPHLSTSKLTQQADKKIHIGQEKILTEKGRDRKDRIIVTEKIDGSNVGVVRKDGELVAIGRSGYTAESSPYRQHELFAEWVKNQTMFDWLLEGWRISGEWCILAHGTKYDITDESPFLAFDIFDENNARIGFDMFKSVCTAYNVPMVPVLHDGEPISILDAIELLGDGHYGKPELPEGVVYRCEREGKCDFLAKWVRGDKEDGKYLDVEVWNTGAEQYI